MAPSVVVLLASHKADFLSKIHGLKIYGGSAGYPCAFLVRAWVCVYPRAYVCAYVRASVRAYVARLFVGIQAKKPYDPQKRLKFGLIRPYWNKTTKTDYKRK